LITKKLLKAIQKQYRLSWHGTHGIGHWARVRENGLYIADNIIGVNKTIIELFAVFHDSGRQNEHIDDGHGYRGAELANQLRGTFFELGDQDFELLYTACCHHTDTHFHENITVQACWDADRLDLGRVGKTPIVDYFGTAIAKEPKTVTWATKRAQGGLIPEFALEEWF
jgi:uncharacterized protein